MKKVIAVVVMAVIGYLVFHYSAAIRRYVQINILEITGQQLIPASRANTETPNIKNKNAKKPSRTPRATESEASNSERRQSAPESTADAGDSTATTSGQQPMTLLSAVVRPGQLDPSQSYEVTAAEEELHRRYQEIQQKFEAQVRDQQLSLPEIKQLGQDLDRQKSNLAREYGLTLAQLNKFEKYMNR